MGLEIDFSPRHVDRCIETVNTFDLDVVGSSVHFLDGEDVVSLVSRCSAWGRGEISAADVYPKYLGVLESMLDYDYFDVIYHLQLPKKYNQRPSPSAVQWIPASGRFLPSTAGRRFISV